MNETERAACSRVKEFRESIKWPQADFAAQIGITLNQLASIEYGRTPLRYEIAWFISNLFELNLEWFLGLPALPSHLSRQIFPTPRRTGLPKSALLSEVIERFYGDTGKVRAAKRQELTTAKITIDDDELRERVFVLMRLKSDLEYWIAKLPAGLLEDFQQKLVHVSDDYFKAIHEESPDIVNAWHDALLRDSRFSGLADRVIVGKIDLTYSSGSVYSAAMNAHWPALKKRLRQATAQIGAKSVLAKILNVDPTQISQWLSDSKSAREPGAEYALQMQAWLNDPKRATK
jgi:transcriptional regulator with XRE-family HTH domain